MTLNIVDLIASPKLLLGQCKSLHEYLSDSDLIHLMTSCRYMYKEEFCFLTFIHEDYFSFQVIEHKQQHKVRNLIWYNLSNLEWNEWINVKKISVFNNELTRFVPCLSHTHTALIDIDLSGNSFKVYDDLFTEFTKYLNVNNNLKFLNLNRCQLEARKAGLLAQALQSNTSLRRLELRSNNITDIGADHFAHFLLSNNTLQELDLSRNSVGEQGCSNIARALKINVSLVSIKLRHNQIGNKGATYLADTMRINKTLSRVDLRGNWIGYFW